MASRSEAHVGLFVLILVLCLFRKRVVVMIIDDSKDILRDIVLKDMVVKDIVFPSEYYYRGASINMASQLVKTYEVWYSESLNRSRISYYGGTDNIIYYADNGYVYNVNEVHPMTSSDLEVEVACFSSLSSNEKPDFLPEVAKLVYTGTEQEIDVWNSEEAEGVFYKNLATLYTYRNNNEDDIPVKYEVKKINLDSGAILEHNIELYIYFELTVNDEDLTYPYVEDCESFSANFNNNIHFLRPDFPEHLDVAFDGYINHHNRKYNEEEHQLRKRIFHKNWRMVHEVNGKNVSYKLALNKFSDQTKEELYYLTGTFPSDPSKIEATPFPYTMEEINQLAKELPETFDMRVDGYISKVKDQANCGSCWAFSVTAAVEGVLARSNGELYDLSEQSLVDCTWGYYNLGCNGGYLDRALKYVSDYGIPTEEEYGNYLDTDGYCRTGNMSKTFFIRGITAVTPLHPNALKLALYNYGPVSVTIYASDILVYYSSGVFYDVTCEGHKLNHAVTVVGYGVRDGDEYWIVKNSWGEMWGEDGYVLFANKNNNCFLLDAPYCPYL